MKLFRGFVANRLPLWKQNREFGYVMSEQLTKINMNSMVGDTLRKKKTTKVSSKVENG